jgi:hypothetical protein
MLVDIKADLQFDILMTSDGRGWMGGLLGGVPTCRCQ